MAVFGGIRGLAQAFLRSAAEMGLSANEAIRQISASGLGTYRRSDMLADYRQFLGIPAKADRIKNVRLDYRPSQDLFTDVTGYQRSLYRYQVRVECHNPVSGKSFTMNTNIASEEQLTRRQIEESGLDAVLKTVDDYKDDIVSYGVVAAFHQEGEAWD
jgi:hypothetical protein